MDVIEKYGGDNNSSWFEDIDYDYGLELISRVSWNRRFGRLLSLPLSPRKTMKFCGEFEEKRIWNRN